MGIFRDINNRKKTMQQVKSDKKKGREVKAARKVAARRKIPINIEDVELYSNQMLKNKLRNPRNNIQISGKNRKRSLKRLKYQMRDEQKNSEEDKTGDFVKDLFMEDEEEVKTTKDESVAPSATEMADGEPSSSSGTTATKKQMKKKRGGKKNKKKKNAGKGGDEGAGDDVEMEEL